MVRATAEAGRTFSLVSVSLNQREPCARFFYKQHFYKQHQTETGEKISKS